ncbi:hypothetical protein J6590_079137 [Homalodisca vitripennis]|nr:hypothetical protein J6590_079137 [Homalodisca vitripennis]
MISTMRSMEEGVLAAKKNPQYPEVLEIKNRFTVLSEEEESEFFPSNLQRGNKCHGRTRSMVLFTRRHHNCFLEANCTMERFQQLGNPISNYLDSFRALLTSLKLLLHGSE